MNHPVPTFAVCALFAGCFAPAVFAEPDWRDARHRATLQNDSMQVEIQAGIPTRLVNRQTGEDLLNAPVESLPSRIACFGTSFVDLDTSTITQQAGDNEVETTYQTDKGTTVSIRWQIEPGNGDIVLNASAKTSKPVEDFRTLLFGCDITRHTMVWIHAYGVGHAINAPWQETVIGDPSGAATPSGFPHPIVALFEGKTAGWFIEGREERVGPANFMAKGNGESVNLGFNRKFPIPTTEPKLFEVRIRTYQEHWADAVDPYVAWLEEGAGFVPLAKLPEGQAWVNNLRTQAYIFCGDYESLEDLAKRVNPAETFVGRQGDLRPHEFDVAYPDYRLSDKAKKWVKRARELGFHVGMHFNSKSVSALFPELIERFRPGMQETGKDAQGNTTYEHIYSGENSLYRVSAGLKDWRDYLIDSMKDAVDSGIDVIYLDESMSPGGKFMVDGVDGFQGMFLLMQEIQQRYPHVAVETEQFNTLTGKFGKIALSQMPLGHPLSGYIYQNYIKVVPEGLLYSPDDNLMMDGYDAWGFMLPGAHTLRSESGMRIAEAFHQYKLVPDPRLPRLQITNFQGHYTHGQLPVLPETIPSEGWRLFGFQGADGVTAYFERHPTQRGLVVYEPGKDPKWIGERHTGIRKYEGAGVPVMFTFRERVTDWLVYDDTALLGLDPAQTYWFDETRKTDPERFHIYRVPGDYVGFTNSDKRLYTQETAPDESFFYVRFAGHGPVSAYIPDAYEAVLNGKRLEVDRKTKSVHFDVNADASLPSSLGYHIELAQDKSLAEPTSAEKSYPVELLAFRRDDTPLTGNWTDLKWYGTPDTMKWIKVNDAGGLSMSIGTVGKINGKFPEARTIHLRGTFQIADVAGGGFPGDGVIRINGVEVARIPHGETPFPKQAFDVDVSKHAGEHAFIEFTSDGPVRAGWADWNDARIVIDNQE